VLHRERLLHGPTEPSAASLTLDDGIALPTPPPDSLLAMAHAHASATALIREARDACLAAPSDAVPQETLIRLKALPDALAILNARATEAASLDLIRQAERRTPRADLLGSALAGMERRLAEELALIGVALFPPGSGGYSQDSPFGPEVDALFPEAAYHIEEACRCLGLHRGTAAVMHGMRIMQLGLRALTELLGVAAVEGLGWVPLMTMLRHAGSGHDDLIDALDLVRRRWRSRTLLPADKYTVEEARAVIDAVGDFLRTLALHQRQHDAAGASHAAWPSPAAAS
jgi:hypothetical protein